MTRASLSNNKISVSFRNIQSLLVFLSVLCFFGLQMQKSKYWGLTCFYAGRKAEIQEGFFGISTVSWKIHQPWTGIKLWQFQINSGQQYCQWQICTAINRIRDQHSGHDGNTIKWFGGFLKYFFRFIFSFNFSVSLSRTVKHNWCSRQTQCHSCHYSRYY